MIRNICLAVVVAILLPVTGAPQSSRVLPTFAEFEVPVYKGKIKRPKWISFSRRNGWRDSLGKLVDPPEVNFAGKFFAVGHSCGTGCRYYSLTDLTTGKDLSNVFDGFGSGEEPPKTKDGYEYYERFFLRPNSRLLIVQYDVEKQNETVCRERSFLLGNGRLRPVTPTVFSCRNLE